ncbi:hypothetical protein OAB94_02205, partial [Flavobacteriaceae bacterium]|nr:hypothetical protein [Flavobacteriaceae bacterium]
MTIIERVLDFGVATLNLLWTIIYLPIALFSVLWYLVTSYKRILSLIGLLILSYLVLTYVSPAIESVEFAFRCRVHPFYEENVRPILDGIIRKFFNSIICWWNAFVWFPYGTTREVVFPLARECGFVPLVRAFGDFIGVLFKDWLIDYVSSRQFLQADLDFTRICAAWQDIWIKWQSLLCCGCMDLCPLLTKTPAIPSFFASDQLRDVQTWCFISNTFNGGMRFLQEALYVLRELIYPTQPVLPRPTFRRAFDAWCDASTCFWRSWENALQNLWDTFVPYEFVWKDMFCMFDTMWCATLRTLNLLIKIILNGNMVLNHFTNTDSTYWINVVKEDYKEILNLWGPTAFFEPITQTLPDSTVMEITHYQLLNTVQAKPNGDPNPLYGKLTVTKCSCIFITRLLCDPTNNGTTCKQRYEGTLLEDFDFCCFGENLITFFVDIGSWIFEFTLHLQGPSNFVVFLDKQPFTTSIKTDLAKTFECLYGVFLAVDLYGKCIQTVLSELTLFVVCMFELLFRLVVALISLPYYETSLPGTCNFLTCPGDEALNMAIGFLERLVSTSPDSLLNCMCFLLNTGFPVPPAGCTNGCVVGGFQTPTMKKDFTGTGTYREQLNPIYNYAKKEIVTQWNAQMWWEEMSFKKTGSAFGDVSSRLDFKLSEFSKKLAEKKCSNNKQEKLVTSPTVPPIVCDPPPLCFDLCCLPKSVLVLFAHGTAFVFRGLNAAFQTRGATGSPYFDGTGCSTGPCLQSDLTAFIVNLIAPLKCLCNTIHLLIPPSGFPDPCCFFTLLGEGLSCIVQVAINIITSSTSDPNFTYIKTPTGLLADFDILLTIANATFECLCTFIRIIFGLVLDVSNLVKNYDPCCIPQKLFQTLIEIIRLVGQTVISLATLETPTSECYFYIRTIGRPTCELTLNTLPILVQFDNIRKVLLAPPSPEVLSNCAPQVDPSLQDQSKEGIATCICTLLNAILSKVFLAIDPNNPNTCPVDLCCVVYNTGIFIDELFKFGSRLLASLWQNWESRSQATNQGNVGPFLIPTEFVEFFFCDEYYQGEFAYWGVINPEQDLSTQKCGKLEPVLQSFKTLAVGCVCSAGRGVGDVFDNFLEWFLAFVSTQDADGNSPFPINLRWPRCLCNGGPGGDGILPPLADLIVVAARQIFIALRNINNPSYWAPAGGSLVTPGYAGQLIDNIEDLNNTWISRFLSPFASAACKFVTNSGCLLSMILGNTCETSRYNFLSSAIRYLFEALIRVIALFEGFVKLIAQELPGQCVGNPEEFNGSNGEGEASSGGAAENSCSGNGFAAAYNEILNGASLGRILTALLTFVADALIGIGRLGCTSICPTSSFILTPTTLSGIAPETTACSCYDHTPYTASSGSLCNFTVCQAYGAPTEVCPNMLSECTVDAACGAVGSSRDNCPRFGRPDIFDNFFHDCRTGCKNMPEAVVTVSPIDNTWIATAATTGFPWIPFLIAPTIPVCTISNYFTVGPIKQSQLTNEAQRQFGSGYPGNTAIFQPLCTRASCIARGFCKNDQNVACYPGDPRGVLDGIFIVSLKYLKCLLGTLFGSVGAGVGALVDPLLLILSFIWQLSGGLIRFGANLTIFMIRIVIRPVWVNLFSIVPDTIALLGWFIAIFTQPVLLTAGKSMNVTNSTYVNPLQQAAADKYDAMAMNLFGTNLDGCIDDPIPCFCTHMNLTSACDTDIGSLTLPQVATLMGEVFDGITECDSLIQHCATMQPALWTDVPYSERYQYIDCVAKRVQGERFSQHGTDKWPKDFFYSQDGWYKLFSGIKDGIVDHVSKTSKAEQELLKKTQNASNFTEFYRNLDNRAKIVRNLVLTRQGVARDSPAVDFVVSMDSFWHKYNMGYYHILSRRAWNNIKSGKFVLGTTADNVDEMSIAMTEITSSFGHLKRSLPHAYQSTMRGLDAVGSIVSDIVYNRGRNIRGFHNNNDPIPPTPILIKATMDGSLFKHINIRFKLPNVTNMVAHIWKNIKRIEFKFETLSWMQEPKWTPEKLYNYESLQRLFTRVFHVIWPHYTPQDKYEKFILGGNCKLVDGVVEVGMNLVDYCLNDFEANYPANKSVYLRNTSPLRKNSFFNRFDGRIEYKSRYPGNRLRPRIVTPKSSEIKPRFDRRVYRRANMQTPGSFSLTDWVICTVEDLFDI